MPPLVQTISSRITSFWSASSPAQRILTIGLGISLVLVFFLMLFWFNQVTYKVLYSNLYPEDASRVVAFLEKEKVEYKLKDNGSTIMVPESRVYNLRLALAGAGALHGQGIGFELFDATQIGQTDFIQHINYQRALQGELARTIAEYPDILSARVHLVIPDKSLFIEEQAPTSASVVLKMRNSKTLSQQEIQSIVNLVTTGVEGMTTEHITISTTKGRVLYQPRNEEGVGMTSTQFEYQQNMQHHLERRIEQLLTPIVGQDKVVARVAADLDFNQTDTHEELYDPEVVVVRSEQRSEEETAGFSKSEQGSPEAEYQANNMGSAGTSETSSRTESHTNYEINKVDKHIVSSLGKIERLSVAVIVDGTYEKNEQGEYVYQPLPKAQMERIRSLVEKAVGFDAARSDSIEVSNISFGPPETEPLPTMGDTVVTYFKLMGKPLLNTLLVLLFLLLIVRPVIMTIIKPKVSSQEMEAADELPEGEAYMALGQGVDEEAAQNIEEQTRIHDAKAYAVQLVEENMDQAVLVIKQWVTKGG
ncbi:MAG: flagellar M-ring protein FliF [Deltaproteobacteria bacterium]|nr:MAG: flagellar M-ring protein FliF [Deltaproteobacteria bacterium]